MAKICCMSKNWTLENTKFLFDTVKSAKDSNAKLNTAFVDVARKVGKSINSVRNYYYSQSRLLEILPQMAKSLGIDTVTHARKEFEPFKPKEVESLMEYIFSARGRGISVRSAILEHSNGDSKLALRYQNKYRSTVMRHKPLVYKVLNSLVDRGVACRDPYTNRTYVKSDNAAENNLIELIKKLSSKEVDVFVDLMTKLVK
ncbi:MAG: hypothetical protein FWC80_02450 [Firmicutes bacterium]|nr:hypothetical protein [Bacillota bacterium]